MKVSVVIPNYCHAVYLTERIESVLAQSFTDFEVIILDDYSTDNSRDVIERYRSHPKVSHIIYNERNSGSPFRQWLKGIELAQGEYVWIAESDDVADPKFLEYCVAVLDCNKGCTLAFTNCCLIDADGVIVGQLPHIKDSGVYEGRDFVRRYLSTRNIISNASMAVFRKSALPKKRNFVDYRYCGDWLFWINVAVQGHVAYVNLQLDKFRKHGVNTTCKAERTGEGFIETVRLLKELFDVLQASTAFRQAIVGKHLIYTKKMSKREHWDAPTRLRVSRAWSELTAHPKFSMCWYRIYKIFCL